MDFSPPMDKIYLLLFGQFDMGDDVFFPIYFNIFQFRFYKKYFKQYTNRHILKMVQKSAQKFLCKKISISSNITNYNTLHYLKNE